MQRNSNRVEPRPMQERDVLTCDIVLAVLLPECCRALGPKELEHQGLNLSRRLRPPFKQPHVAFRHQPISQIYCANKEWLASSIDDLFVVGVCELRVPLRSESQKKQRHL